MHTLLQRQVTVVMIVLMAIAMLAGCVRSQASRYQHQLSAITPASEHPSHAVAAAFGLDSRENSAIGIAAVTEP